MVRFMEEVDLDFNPPLKGRADFNGLIDKVLSNGYCYVAFNDNNIIGAIMFYCNDLTSKVAYINYYAVLPERRQKGIGSQLMDFSLKKSLEQGMEKIGVHTWSSNKKTLKLYEGMGFAIKENYDGLNGERLFLEKALK